MSHDVVDDSLRPVLVGGTGRSGSTIVGHLLDHHPALTLCRPMEVRFIAGNDGLADALAVALSDQGPEAAHAAASLAVDRILHRWFERAENVGLHQSMSRHEIEVMTGEYLAEFATDPKLATQRLTFQIMDRIAERLGALRLVDTTPANARKADRLEPIYPQSSVVVVTRDGRDVAASFASQTFGPNNPYEALSQWEQRMLRAHKAAARSRPGRVLTIELMDLVVRDRTATVARLCDFVGVEVDPHMITWFDEQVTADGMHPGRWRADFDAEMTARLESQYEKACERLTAAGVAIPD
jgi:hypothetical protein